MNRSWSDDCPHKIKCCTHRWVCGLKTKLAHAVTDGDVTMDQANHLLGLYGEHPLIGKPPMTGAKLKELPDLLQQELL